MVSAKLSIAMSRGKMVPMGGSLNDGWVRKTISKETVTYDVIHKTFDNVLHILISPNNPLTDIEIMDPFLKIIPKFDKDGFILRVEFLSWYDQVLNTIVPSGKPKDIMVGLGVIGNIAGYGGQLLTKPVHEGVTLYPDENFAFLALGAPAARQEILLSEEKPSGTIVTQEQIASSDVTLWYGSVWLATCAIEVTHNGKKYYGNIIMTRNPDSMEKTFTYIYPPDETDFEDWFKQNGHISYNYKYNDQSILISADTYTHMGEGTNTLPITTSISNIRIDYNTTDNDHTILSYPITIDVSSDYRKWSVFWYTQVIGYRSSTIGVNDVLMSKTQEIRQRPIAGSFVFRKSTYIPPFANVYINGTYIGRINADLSSGVFYFQLPEKYYTGRNIQYNKFPFK